MSKYQYKSPITYGFKKIKLTNEEFEQIFKRKKKYKLFVHYNIYKKENEYKCEH